MTTQQKLALIDQWEGAAKLFDGYLELPAAILAYRPAPDMWTIHEHIVHTLESEICAFHRYRKAIAEPGGEVLGYDEEAWTPALDYHGNDLDDVVALFKMMRKLAAAHLRRIAGADWSVYRYKHNQFGMVGLEK